MKKIFLLLLALLLVPLSLNGCASPSLDVGAALTEFTESYEKLPMGQHYTTEDGSISTERLLSLYDPDGSLPDRTVLSAALYLGCDFDEVSELALFDCAGSDAAMRVAELCHRRAAFLQHFDRDLEYTVIRYGEYVFFAALPSLDGVEKLADRIFT